MSVEAIVGIAHVGESDGVITVHHIGIALLVVLEKPVIDLLEVENSCQSTMRSA